MTTPDNATDTPTWNMFGHILIPTDLGDQSERALEITKQLVGTAGSKVTLLHVIETIPATTVDEFKDFYAELEKRSADKLGSLAARLDGIETIQEVVYGKPAAKVVEFAETQAVDLIVLASHRFDPAEPGPGWATLSHKIGILAPCPVLLVK